MKKTAIVSGGTRGIGKAVSLRLLKEDYRLIAIYNKNEKEARNFKKEAEKISSSFEILKAGLQNDDEVKMLYDYVHDKYKTLDVLVNNAGVQLIKQIQDTSFEDCKRVIDSNLFSIFNMCRHFSKMMIRQKSGVIINISSMWGECGASMESIYAASKGAVNAFTKSLSKELAPSKIRVNAVAPGLIESDMLKDLKEEDIKDFIESIPLSRIGKAEDVGDIISFLISEKASYISGAIINVNGGYI